MTDWIPKLIDLLKLPTKLVAVLCLVSGSLALFPVERLQKLHLEKVSSEYGLYIGLTFLVSGVLVGLEILLWLWNKIKIVWLKRKLTSGTIEELQELDPREIAVIREFYIQGQSTLQLPMSHPLVASLIEKGILRQVGSLGEHSIVGPLISLKVSSIVTPHITYELLNLPNGEPTDEQIDWVRSNRPEFMRELDRRKSLYYGF